MTFISYTAFRKETFVAPIGAPILEPIGQADVGSNTCIDIFDEDFSVTPVGWTSTGTITSVVSGELRTVITSGSDSFLTSTNFGTPARTQLWAKFLYRTDSGITFPTGNQLSFFEFQDSGSNLILRLGLINQSGILRWLSTLAHDGGNSILVPSTPVGSLGTTFTITIQWLQSTTSSSADGGAHIWVNTDPVRNTLTFNNIVVGAPETVLLGAIRADGGVNGNSFIDDFELGTFCVAP